MISLTDFILIIFLFILLFVLYKYSRRRFKWILNKDQELYLRICKVFEKKGFEVLKLDIVPESELKEINSKYSNKTNLIVFYYLTFFRRVKIRKNERKFYLVIKVVRSRFFTYEINIIKYG